jgi:hypothetical protein
VSSPQGHIVAGRIRFKDTTTTLLTSQIILTQMGPCKRPTQVELVFEKKEQPLDTPVLSVALLSVEKRCKTIILLVLLNLEAKLFYVFAIVESHINSFIIFVT